MRLLRSNLRAPEGVTTRVVYIGNPGGALMGRIYDRHVKHRRSHVPYEVDGETPLGWPVGGFPAPQGPYDAPAPKGPPCAATADGNQTVNGNQSE